MRAIALAAAAAALLVGTAYAQQAWNDPARRLTFSAPAGWATSQERGQNPTDTFTYVISGSANNECQFIVRQNPNTATANADVVRRQSGDATRFTNEVWTATLNSIPGVFPNNSARVISTSVETTGPWPIQRAEVQSPDRLVHAALQLRPGFDMITLCMTYDGPDRTDVYDQVIRSVAHPRDAEFAAAADQAGAARTAQQEAQRRQNEEAAAAQAEVERRRQEDAEREERARRTGRLR